MIKTRKYQLDDKSEVMNLFKELQNYEKRLYSDKKPATDLFADEYVTNLLHDIEKKEGMLYVAEEEDTICGFIAGYVEEDIENESDYFYVSDLIVSEAFRGKGIGAALMKKLEDYAVSTGQTKMIVGVLVDNEAARGLYTKLGYNDYEIEMIKDIGK